VPEGSGCWRPRPSGDARGVDSPDPAHLVASPLFLGPSRVVHVAHVLRKLGSGFVEWEGFSTAKHCQTLERGYAE